MTRPGAITDIARVQDPAVRRALQSLAEAVEFREGRRPQQNALDRFVTLRELRDQSSRDVSEAVGRATAAAGGSGGGTDGELDLTPPPQPSGVSAVGGVGQIILSWDSPWDAYGNHSLTEVWRSDVSDIGQATLVTRNGGRVWVDADLSEGATRYYRFRFVSLAGVEGPFSDVVSATAVRSAETVRDALTASVWEASTAYTVFAVVAPTTPYTINGVEARFQAQGAGTSGATEPDWTAATAFGDTVADGTITWRAIEVGKVPFITGTVGGVPTVFMHGAAMQSATIKDAAIESLNATKLFAATGTIAEAIIGTGHVTNAMIGNIIQSANYQAGTAGWKIEKTGFAELNTAIIRGDLYAADIYGGWIEGAAIVGSTTLKPTELDPGNNTYLAYDSTLSWSYSDSRYGGGWIYGQECDIYSANHSDTNEYRRFRRHDANIKWYIEGNTQVAGSDAHQHTSCRVRLYQNGSLVVDTGTVDLFQLLGTYYGDNGPVSKSWGPLVISAEVETPSMGFTYVTTPIEILLGTFDGDGKVKVHTYWNTTYDADSSDSHSQSGQATAYNDY